MEFTTKIASELWEFVNLKEAQMHDEGYTIAHTEKPAAGGSLTKEFVFTGDKRSLREMALAIDSVSAYQNKTKATPPATRFPSLEPASLGRRYVKI